MPNYSRAAGAALNVHPITPAIGAEIHGVRLSGDLPTETVTAIRDALLRHRVVFFRGQGHLDEAEHQAFARLLGPFVPHPTVPSLAGTEAVLDIDAENARARYWHTDVTFVPAFPLFSVLRGVVIPPVGGDTVWANTVAAYDTLPPVLRGLAVSAVGAPQQCLRLWRNTTQCHVPPGATLRDRVQIDGLRDRAPGGAGASADRGTGDHPRLFRPQLLGVSAVAVGTEISPRPPHRSVRAAFPHTAPTSGE
jgi:hypothetical protein